VSLGAKPILWPGQPYPLGAVWDGAGVERLVDTALAGDAKPSARHPVGTAVSLSGRSLQLLRAVRP
jgi:hypothetical protein